MPYRAGEQSEDDVPSSKPPSPGQKRDASFAPGFFGLTNLFWTDTCGNPAQHATHGRESAISAFATSRLRDSARRPVECVT
eukprot:7382816-Prymnesium_polylepis.1